MLWTRIFVAVALVVGEMSLPNAAWAQSSPFVGRWHLNIGQSSRPSGEALPPELLTDIARVDVMHVRWSTTTTDSRGQKDVETFDTPGNGEFYSLDGHTMVSHQLSLTSLKSTYRDSFGQTDALTCTLSDAAQKLTCNGVITHQDGSLANYTDVFDRL